MVFFDRNYAANLVEITDPCLTSWLLLRTLVQLGFHSIASFSANSLFFSNCRHSKLSIIFLWSFWSLVLQVWIIPAALKIPTYTCLHLKLNVFPFKKYLNSAFLFFYLVCVPEWRYYAWRFFSHDTLRGILVSVQTENGKLRHGKSLVNGQCLLYFWSHFSR